MGVDLCKFCKESKCEKGEREDRGSCWYEGFKRVLDFEGVEFWGEVVWEGPVSLNLASHQDPWTLRKCSV